MKSFRIDYQYTHNVYNKPSFTSFESPIIDLNSFMLAIDKYFPNSEGLMKIYEGKNLIKEVLVLTELTIKGVE